MHRMQRCRGLYIFQMSQNRVCIRSVFEKKIGPYEVCIFVNIGPYEKSAALHNHPGQHQAPTQLPVHGAQIIKSRVVIHPQH